MEKKGFKVLQASGVKEGINHVKSSPPAFAIVDLRLGDGNGLEVVKEIRKLKDKSRIIMLTGYETYRQRSQQLKLARLTIFQNQSMLMM